jgi:hypothetical protein
MDREMVSKLTCIKDEAWDSYGMQREPLLRKIDKEKHLELAALAHSTGKELARKLKAEYGSMTPSEIARKLGIKINRMELSDEGCYNTFACYQKPDRIDVYMKTIEAAEDVLVEFNGMEMLQNVSIEELLIAHELFHYYENTREAFPTKQKLIVLWELGKFKYKACPVSIGEMAAMAFARELLGLSYSPYVFDVILSYPQNREMAEELYNFIVKLNGSL